MSKRRHRQPTPPEHFHCVGPLPGEDATKIVPNCDNDDSSAKLDIADAIAKEIDMTWAIIAVIEILLRESGGHKYAQGGLRLAHAHLDGLCAIQRDIDRVWQSE